MAKNSTPPANYQIFRFLLLAFLIGIFFSTFIAVDFYQIYPLVLIFALIFFALSLIFKKEPIVKVATAMATSFFVGLLLFTFANTRLNNLALPYDQEKEFTGLVASYPEFSGNSQSIYFLTSDFGPPTKIYLSTSRYPAYNYGDKLKIKSKILRPQNFTDFDWVSYLKRRGAVATTSSNPEITFISSGNGSKILLKLYAIRKNFEQAVQKNLPEPESSLAVGLLIGSKQGFGQDLLNDFSKVGITHIIALSGYNVTIIIIFLTDILLGILTRRQIFAVSLILILLFVAMTGAASSVIRATIITLLIAFGKTIGRKADMTNLILLSASVMVAVNPFVLRYDSGFQLSFLAFIGLVYFSPIMGKLFDRKFFTYWPKAIKAAIIETSSAQIAVLPLILSLFGLVSLIAPVTNVLILPIIPAAMLFVFLSTLIYWILPVIGKLAFLISYLPLKYILVVAQYFARLPLTAIQISGHWQVTIITVYILAIVTIFIKFRRSDAQKVY